MLPWMIYVVLVSLLLSAAALAAEKAARLRSAPTRWIWLVAMVASLLIPTITISVALQVPAVASQAGNSQALAPRPGPAVAFSPARWAGADLDRALASRSLDAWLFRGWIAASATLALFLLLSSASLSRRKRRWARSTVAGEAVYVAPDLGPAVVGLLRPQIVVPAWLAQLPAAQQSVVIAHERAHVIARDPQALGAALGALVCMPWNVPLWWRLRGAPRRGGGLRRRRAARWRPATGVRRDPVGGRTAAVGIDHRHRDVGTPIIPGRKDQTHVQQTFQVVGAGGRDVQLPFIGIGGDGNAGGPARRHAAGAQGGAKRWPATATPGARVSLAPAVLDGYAGYYQYGEDAEFTTVTRQGDHLVVEFPGVSPLPMFPQTSTTFAGEAAGVQVSFTLAADGTASAAVLSRMAPARRCGASMRRRQHDCGLRWRKRSGSRRLTRPVRPRCDA